MLYLEDYLEMIEHLPQELKDRFTEIRELDLEVQNASDQLDHRVKSFFQTARKQKISERDNEFESFRKEFYKVLENADEKVNQANQLYDLVDRYLRKLDKELHKFKMELEADNAGITEVLEKRSLELDKHERDKETKNKLHSQKENRLIAGQMAIKTEKKTERKNSYEKAGTSSSAVHSGGNVPLPYNNLGSMGIGGNAIAAAASQAIAATQQMQQGRRTASLKASYDAVNLGLQPAEFNVGTRDLLVNAELHQAAQQALAAMTSDRSGFEQNRNPKRKSQHTHNSEFLPPPNEEPDEASLMETDAADWAMDTGSEPRYCLCNEISYGDMVACDNESCPIEWFHYGCVGITQTPKGKWYCPQCSASMKRRGRR